MSMVFRLCLSTVYRMDAKWCFRAAAERAVFARTASSGTCELASSKHVIDYQHPVHCQSHHVTKYEPRTITSPL